MTPEQLLQELEAFDLKDITSVPGSVRARLAAAASKVCRRLETPTDTVSRVLITQPVEEISIRIGADLKIFSTLAKKDTTNISELAKTTGAEPELLTRILRSLAAFHAIKEVSTGEYAPVPSYAFFQDSSFEQAFGGCQDILDKSRRSLPAFLQSTKYTNPTDPKNTAVQFAYNTPGQTYLNSLMSDPSSKNSLGSFVKLMSVWAEGFSQVQDIYPVSQRLQENLDPMAVTFVDVGGGLGQKSIALKKAHPDLSGQFVVQDLEPVIANAPVDDPMYKEIMLTVHDFTTEQPIKGAKCYYIRQCLHNWPDDVCVTILRRLGEAAKPGYSVILIHEIIVLETGSDPWIVSQDFNMMSMFAVGERTESEWRDLCDKAGLKVSGIYLNDHPSREGIIEAVIQ